MTHTVHTGKGMTFLFNSIAGDGLRTVDIADDAVPLPKRLDGTDSNVTAYYEFDDPLGSEEAPKSKVSIELTDSTIGYADNKLVKQALNQIGAVAFATSAVSDDNAWAHATQELISRTTTIPWDDVATLKMEFGANTNGTWSAVA
jgi:hypothetical protein